MTDYIHIAKASLRGHEGLRHTVYKCSEGYNTIAYGRNLDTRGLTTEECEYLLENDIYECIKDLSKYMWWAGLTDRRKAALIDLRYCVGGAGFAGFKKMLKALDYSDYNIAALEILDSKFAKQTGRRADDLARMIEEG